ncbi:MAG TPA: acyl carrier protein [Woeseiaceae bacterium]|nr:acyl carrier protein [Woeseiaceae bacterium]
MNPELRSVFADTLGLDPDAVTADTSRRSEPAWDSLNHLRLVTAVEETFGIKLSMAEIQAITTAGELETMIDGHDKI